MRYKAASDKVISKRMGDEVIVINLENGIYYSILDTGMAMWESVVAGVPVSEIEAVMAGKYPDQPGLSEHIADFIAQLGDEGLIAPAESENGPSHNVEWPELFAPATLEKHEDVSEMVALDPPLPELD